MSLCILLTGPEGNGPWLVRVCVPWNPTPLIKYSKEKYVITCTNFTSSYAEVSSLQANNTGIRWHLTLFFAVISPNSDFVPDLACRGYSIGMEHGKIPDENIIASSWQEPFHAFRPEAGRLNNDDGVWCPNTLGEADKEYFLQVEFPARYNVCAVATQGSPLYTTDWVKKYRIQFSMDGENFTLYTENGTVKVWRGYM